MGVSWRNIGKVGGGARGRILSSIHISANLFLRTIQAPLQKINLPQMVKNIRVCAKSNVKIEIIEI